MNTTNSAHWSPSATGSTPARGLQAQHIILPLLFIAVFTGFQGGRYFMGNALQELGILASGLVFVLSAFVSVFHLDQRRWLIWTLTPVMLMSTIVVVWGCTFAFRFGGNPVMNMAASREFMFILLCPAIYLSVKAGISRQQIEKLLWLAFVALMLNYLFFYFTMDLRDAFFSSDHRISNLVTYDEWRGFRLKPPLFAIMIALLAATKMLFSRLSSTQLLSMIPIISLAVYIWSIVMFRSTLATMILSVVLYPILLSSHKRVPMLLLLIPLAILAAPILCVEAYQHFASAEGGNVRLASYQTALTNLPKYLFLGVGEDTAYGASYQSLFGAKFFPSDLGIIGIAFKYGIIGALLYLFMHFSILFRMVKTNWQLKRSGMPLNPLLWALIIFFTAQSFNLILNPGLAYAQGITVGCIAISLNAILHDEIKIALA